MPTLYELVKESRENSHALQEVIDMFEPKLKKSLNFTIYQEKEDLSQELKSKLVSCIQKYDIDSTPGFWELKEKIKGQEIS